MKTSLFICYLLICQWFMAATIDNIQSGTTYLPAGSSSVDQVITGVDLSKSFLIFTISIDANRPGRAQVSGKMTATNQLQFQREDAGGSPETKIEWQVFEFSSGVFVQRGVVNNVGGGDANVTLGTAVDLSKSFPIVSIIKDGGAYGVDDFLTAEITSTTNLFIERETGDANIQDVVWQVVEWDDASVQQISGTLAAGNDSIAITLPTSVNRDKSFLISYHRLTGNINADDMPSAELYDNNTVIFYRVGVAETCPFLGYVIELSDDTEVIHGAVSMLTTQDSVGVVTCPFNLDSSGIIPPSHFSRTGINCETTDDDMGIAYGCFKLTSDHSINVSRGGTGFRARYPYQILDLSSAPLSGCGNGVGYADRRSDICVAVLPVELVQFAADQTDCSALLFNWTTASEINVSHFQIEGSNNPEQWEKIEQVNATGNSNSNLDYEFKYDLIKSYNYYRLSIEDFDGHIDYSKVLIPSVEPCEEDLIVRYTNNGIQVNSKVKDDLIIYNYLGQTVTLSTDMINLNNDFVEIQTTNLKNGVYIIQIGNRAVKFIK